MWGWGVRGGKVRGLREGRDRKWQGKRERIEKRGKNDRHERRVKGKGGE